MAGHPRWRGTATVSALTDTAALCSHPSHLVSHAGTTPASAPTSTCACAGRRHVHTQVLFQWLLPSHLKWIYSEAAESRLVLLGGEYSFRAVILSHNICTCHSPDVNFHVIYNFSSNGKTKKKHTRYKSYFKTSTFIIYTTYSSEGQWRRMTQPGSIPAVHLPPAPPFAPSKA